MFKSVFVKYITAFMLIIVLSAFFSAAIVTSLVNNYDGNNKNRALESVAYESVSFMTKDYGDSGENSFGQYLNDSAGRIQPVLDAMTANTDDMVLFVADGEGIIQLIGGREAADTWRTDENVLLTYPAAVTDQLTEGGNVTRCDTLDGFFKEKHRIYMQPIMTRDGRTVGSVMTCVPDQKTDELLGAMIKSIIASTVFLMIAALIAVYFITKRLTSPLHAMTEASREFAAGQFDARVEVSGNDEVAELADGFNKMADSLGHSEETRRLFLANVSHDLRTPMTTILGFIESIQNGAIPQDKVPHYLGVISSEVKRLSRLVADLLDITKIEAGERKFVMEPFDICRMAREIIVSSEQRLEEKGLDVGFDCDSENIFVTGDRDAIHQVFYNLCDNAIKFARPGGKYLISVKENGRQVTVSVTNEGDGIAPEDLPYVFDRFYKSDKSRGLDRSGTGLGLYIARTIIEAHGETIGVESEYGSWCRFTFTMQKTSEEKTNS